TEAGTRGRRGLGQRAVGQERERQGPGARAGRLASRSGAREPLQWRPRTGRGAAAWLCPAVETCGRSWTPQGRTTMRKTLVRFANISATGLAVTSAHAQQTIKVGDDPA